jgi:hypothetical protein
MESKKLNRFRYGTYSLVAHVAWPYYQYQKQKISIAYYFEFYANQFYVQEGLLPKKISLTNNRFPLFSNIRPGSNNVRLLNSAVINEFTMLTYRQPLNNRDR